MSLFSLEVTILCRRQLRPQVWRFKSGKASESIFPSNPSAFQQFRCYKRTEKSPLTEKQQRILRKRRMIPYFSSQYHQPIRRKTSSQMSISGIWEYKNIKKPPFNQCFNRILKAAKNLQSLIIESGSKTDSFKALRKARGLQKLDFTILTTQITEYTHLFKRLNALQKIKLKIIGSTKNNQEAPIFNKFFGFLLNLPKLKYLTVWLEKGGDYFQTLLSAIDKRKLASFHIIGRGYSKESQVNWGKFIDTLYIGSISSSLRIDTWPQKFEKRLSLNKLPEINDLMKENITIQNLELVDPHSIIDPDVRHVKNLFKIMSRIKSLKKLTLFFGRRYTISSQNCDKFIKEFSQMECLENLATFTFSFIQKEEYFQRISPPYSSRMKNLKILSLNITGWRFDFSNFAQQLKDLVALENFNFKYREIAVPVFTPNFDLDCNFPFEQLRNLKSINLNCNIPFSANSMGELVESISQVENLESLKIEGHVFDGVERKKASALIGELCLKKNLEYASFEWRGAEVSRWKDTSMRKVNGEVIVSSERKI